METMQTTEGTTFSVMVELTVSVNYELKNEMDKLYTDSIGGLDTMILTHNDDIVELRIVDWEVDENSELYFKEDGQMYTDLILSGLMEIEESSEERALYSSQLLMNELIIKEILVTAINHNHTTTSFRVNDYSNINIESIDED